MQTRRYGYAGEGLRDLGALLGEGQRTRARSLAVCEQADVRHHVVLESVVGRRHVPMEMSLLAFFFTFIEQRERKREENSSRAVPTTQCEGRLAQAGRGIKHS